MSTTNERLVHGDYVEGLTEEQARELLDLCGQPYEEEYPLDVVKHCGRIYFDAEWNDLFYAEKHDCLAFHDFPTFKQKCINTFQL